MNINLIPLHELPIGHSGKVKKLTANGCCRRRLLDLGIIIDTTIKPLKESPAGDPISYAIRGAVIALRQEESCKILVESL